MLTHPVENIQSSPPSIRTCMRTCLGKIISLDKQRMMLYHEINQPEFTNDGFFLIGICHLLVDGN